MIIDNREMDLSRSARKQRVKLLGGAHYAGYGGTYPRRGCCTPSHQHVPTSKLGILAPVSYTGRGVRKGGTGLRRRSTMFRLPKKQEVGPLLRLTKNKRKGTLRKSTPLWQQGPHSVGCAYLLRGWNIRITTIRHWALRKIALYA